MSWRHEEHNELKFTDIKYINSLYRKKMLINISIIMKLKQKYIIKINKDNRIKKVATQRKIAKLKIRIGKGNETM